MNFVYLFYYSQSLCLALSLSLFPWCIVSWRDCRVANHFFALSCQRRSYWRTVRQGSLAASCCRQSWNNKNDDIVKASSKGRFQKMRHYWRICIRKEHMRGPYVVKFPYFLISCWNSLGIARVKLQSGAWSNWKVIEYQKLSDCKNIFFNKKNNNFIDVINEGQEIPPTKMNFFLSEALNPCTNMTIFQFDIFKILTISQFDHAPN